MFLKHLTADWDHLPSPQSPTPSRWQIAIRKTMETLRPTFTYGDERDALERKLSRRRQRQLTKDEHKLKVHERRERAREARRQQQGQTGLRSLADKVQFRKSIFVFATPSATKSRKATSARKRPSATTGKAPTPHRSRSSPHTPTRRPPAPRTRTYPVTTTTTTSAKGPRVVYVTTPVQYAVRPQPKARGSHPSQRQHVTVQTLGPQRSASKTKVVPAPAKRK